MMTCTVAANNPLKRAFYEIDCIKGGWSVRELDALLPAIFDRAFKGEL